MLKEARYFARMMAGCQRFLRTPPLADPKAAIVHNLRHREDNFLALMRDVVFANPANPYHKLFALADCSFGDLEERVRRRGLEGTLRELRAAGVYLGHDEFKGKCPIVRDGREIGVAQPQDLANPLVRGVFEITSSGSRSRGTVTRPSLEFQLYREAQDAILMGQFDPARKSIITLQPILPSLLGINRMLSFDRAGTPVKKWFSLGGTWRDSGHYRLLTSLLVLEARRLGARVPLPDYLPDRSLLPVARSMGQELSRANQVLSMCPVSLAVLVAASARETGISLRGVTFISGGEPLTPARRAAIESAGAKVFPRYATSELGCVGCACPSMAGGVSYHVMMDAVAIISHRRLAPLSDVEVHSLHFTTLSPVSNYVLVNTEMDDCGALSDTTCSCELSSLGFTQQIRDVFSFGKLTGQGITLLGGDLLRVLEVSLPERFGGTPADYQLVELDGADGAIVELRVHPRVTIPSSDAVRDVFLAEVRRLWGGSLTARQWGQTGAVRVISKEPIISGGRKINSLHLLGSGRSPSRADGAPTVSGRRD